MFAVKLIAEGLGLGFLLYLICAIGIRNGAVGMVHLSSSRPAFSTISEQTT